jgi:hypothetical protein
MREVLEEIHGLVKPGRLAIVNYPGSPRRVPEVTTAWFDDLFARWFKDVVRYRGVARLGRARQMC